MTIHDVEQAFTGKLGAERDVSGHHIFFYFNHGGSQFTVAKLSHSWRGDLNDTQTMMLARKLLLQKREFEEFVDCTIESEEMISLWQSRRAARET